MLSYPENNCLRPSSSSSAAAWRTTGSVHGLEDVSGADESVAGPNNRSNTRPILVPAR